MTGYPWATGDALLAADLNAAIGAASSGIAAGGPFLPLSGGTVTGPVTMDSTLVIGSGANNTVTVAPGNTSSDHITLSQTGTGGFWFGINSSSWASISAGPSAFTTSLQVLPTPGTGPSTFTVGAGGINFFTMTAPNKGTTPSLVMGGAGSDANLGMTFTARGSGVFTFASPVAHSSTAGFNGTAPIAKPTVTGAKGSNAALANLMTALAAYGLVTDSTTA